MRPALIRVRLRADELGMEHLTHDTVHAVDASGQLLAEAEAAMAAALQPHCRPGYPSPLEVASGAAVAAAVIALGYASWSSGAAIPFLWGVDLVIHEFGHFVTFWAPWRVTAAAGSFFQVAAPLSLGIYVLVAHRRYGLGAILIAWAGCSARNVAVYIADAPFQRLALWGGDGVLHDWARLLAGWPLQYAGAIAWTVDAMGWLLVVAGLAIALAPVVLQTRSALAADSREAKLDVLRASLPVREPHRPIG